MVATIIMVLSNTPDDLSNPKNSQVILSQVESDNIKELEDFGNKLAAAADGICKEDAAQQKKICENKFVVLLFMRIFALSNETNKQTNKHKNET